MDGDWFDSMTDARKRAHIICERIRIHNDRRKVREAAVAAAKAAGQTSGYSVGMSPRERPVRAYVAIPGE